MNTVPVVRFVVSGQEQSGIRCEDCYTVVYDGNCKVCGRLVTLLRSWDRSHILEIVPSQAPGVQARFPWIPARAYMESVQLISPTGETFQGAAALEEILRVLPKGKWIAWVFYIPGVRILAEKFYRWFARNRYKLGCGEHCAYRPTDVNFENSAENP